MEPMASTPLRFTLALLGMYAISLATLLIIVYRRTVVCGTVGCKQSTLCKIHMHIHMHSQSHPLSLTNTKQQQGHGDAMLMGGSPHGEGLFPFAALTLGSWDYGLTSPQASQRLRAVIAARLTVGELAW